MCGCVGACVAPKGLTKQVFPAVGGKKHVLRSSSICWMPPQCVIPDSLHRVPVIALQPATTLVLLRHFPRMMFITDGCNSQLQTQQGFRASALAMAHCLYPRPAPSWAELIEFISRGDCLAAWVWNKRAFERPKTTGHCLRLQDKRACDVFSWWRKNLAANENVRGAMRAIGPPPSKRWQGARQSWLRAYVVSPDIYTWSQAYLKDASKARMFQMVAEISRPLSTWRLISKVCISLSPALSLSQKCSESARGFKTIQRMHSPNLLNLSVTDNSFDGK